MSQPYSEKQTDRETDSNVRLEQILVKYVDAANYFLIIIIVSID